MCQFANIFIFPEGESWNSEADSSKWNKCVDQNCTHCKNSNVFVIKLCGSGIFPNYPSTLVIFLAWHYDR